MDFCTECDNMLYLKTKDATDLVQYCQNCGFETDSSDPSSTMKSVVVAKRQLGRSNKSFAHLFNAYTKYDPTIPRTNKMLCPQKDCPSNRGAEATGTEAYDIKRDATKAIPQREGAAQEDIARGDDIGANDSREVLIIRVDGDSMTYLFYCAKCDYYWQTKSDITF